MESEYQQQIQSRNRWENAYDDRKKQLFDEQLRPTRRDRRLSKI
jgi:hypothetical protein